MTGPLAILRTWIDEARAAGAPEPEAMALATVSADGRPSARFVLCRGIDDAGVRFFTHYDSRKGRELAHNPNAAAAFHWATLHRQLRLEGAVEPLPAADSDAYFHSRPRGSQLAACVSPQSAVIAGLHQLRARHRALEQELAGKDVPRPARWGGYRLCARAVELWIAGPDRLHERVRYERDKEGGWREERLAP